MHVIVGDFDCLEEEKKKLISKGANVGARGSLGCCLQDWEVVLLVLKIT
ncbi:hypothetical protein [Wolbachia endosymbiont of Trichogramma pretiosum]|nr:hypothetical protein [Wolbachia endosymbiont of Trichogramma pretiosum]OCA06119.1 hypothetical protein wTpre_442 [Wolbachia endosymbiont of Trichogramma pretiosum]